MPVLLNAGAGHADSPVPGYFAGWQQIRVDVNARVNPDIVASITDLSALATASVDAVWSAHCVEHLFAHEVPVALAEFRRVLRPGGFAGIIVPDIQAIAEWIGTDRLHEVIYQSAAGPVTAHDMLWGFGPAIAAGDAAMAHRCGFTPTLFLERLNGAGFAEIALRRRSNLELAALALREVSGGTGRREALMAALEL
ncbi:MAG: methyltransferase domain-containing protein [Steroidobacteraceae bacterium]|jgi:SAM-dependent methyltransferase